ncbi:MAG TPA: DUF5658 family protein [Candidatus Cloacimonadota bacterium]|nr:DUF5658 family protein [Candidatus Cloacimonadota bacterium]
MDLEQIWTLWSSPKLTLSLGLLFILLNILDGHSTWSVLKPDHYYRERNPIARWIFRKLKLVPGIVIFKAVLLIFLSGCVGFYSAWDAGTINVVLLVANIIFTLVVLHNYRVAKRVHISTAQVSFRIDNDIKD